MRPWTISSNSTVCIHQNRPHIPFALSMGIHPQEIHCVDSLFDVPLGQLSHLTPLSSWMMSEFYLREVANPRSTLRLGLQRVTPARRGTVKCLRRLTPEESRVAPTTSTVPHHLAVTRPNEMASPGSTATGAVFPKARGICKPYSLSGDVQKKMAVLRNFKRRKEEERFSCLRFYQSFGLRTLRHGR